MAVAVVPNVVIGVVFLVPTVFYPTLPSYDIDIGIVLFVNIACR